MIKRSLFKWLLILVGVLSVSLGTVGIFIPVLPTAPFLLLAAACFIRSSDRLYQWLIRHKWFGSFIKNYKEHKAISNRTKVVILLLLWGTLCYSITWIISSWAIRILLLIIGLGVTVHILSLKVLRPD